MTPSTFIHESASNVKAEGMRNTSVPELRSHCCPLQGRWFNRSGAT